MGTDVRRENAGLGLVSGNAALVINGTFPLTRISPAYWWRIQIDYINYIHRNGHAQIKLHHAFIWAVCGCYIRTERMNELFVPIKPAFCWVPGPFCLRSAGFYNSSRE